MKVLKNKSSALRTWVLYFWGECLSFRTPSFWFVSFCLSHFMKDLQYTIWICTKHFVLCYLHFCLTETYIIHKSRIVFLKTDVAMFPGWTMQTNQILILVDTESSHNNTFWKILIFPHLKIKLQTKYTVTFWHDITCSYLLCILNIYHILPVCVVVVTGWGDSLHRIAATALICLRAAVGKVAAYHRWQFLYLCIYFFEVRQGNHHKIFIKKLF